MAIILWICFLIPCFVRGSGCGSEHNTQNNQQKVAFVSRFDEPLLCKMQGLGKFKNSVYSNYFNQLSRTHALVNEFNNTLFGLESVKKNLENQNSQTGINGQELEKIKENW